MAGFPIVGIGASAGGLEAFELFFRPVPANCGMAFILISHLDPDHASLLTEILQRTTEMVVSEAHDLEVVEPNRVYVIPPNRDMTIKAGTLHLSVPKVPRGQRMAIDVFLSSLAKDQGPKAIGIILSGTGTDGTIGLTAILGAGGTSLAQEPSTAKYDGMPRSAINAGCARYTFPAEKMVAYLLGNSVEMPISPAQVQPPKSSADSVSKILQLLKSGAGHDFSLYKSNTICRRIERRMATHNIPDMEIYTRYLGENPKEVQILFKELLINVTRFFRDPETFIILKRDILSALVNDKAAEMTVLRVWVAGCATGEEAYSIAIILRELMEESGRECRVQIYSTDLDDEAIAVARVGFYVAGISEDISPKRLQRFFISDGTGYRIKKEIREMVVFAVHNILKDPPFTKLDLLSCRNVMIYLEPELQNRLIPSFHYALRPGGTLLLSPSEGIGLHTELFVPINRKWKLYKSVPSTSPARLVPARDLSWTAEIRKKIPEEIIKKTSENNFAELTKRALLQAYAPASVVTDLKGDILYVHGDTGKYLRPAPGQATLNVIDMARDGLQSELRVAVYAGANLGTSTLLKEIRLQTVDGTQLMSVSVRPLSEPDSKQGLLLVSFKDIAQSPVDIANADAHPASSEELRKIDELERELTYVKESLHSTIEEQQNFNEELKCVNEEMQSTNEELQSTNEELETSKEELQSVNEELVTVNAELEAKIEQLADMQNDMKNLLENIHVGTIFLDQKMHVRRFTRDAVRIYRLVQSDMGRSLGDIKSDLIGEDLLREAQTVLDTLIPFEREVSTSNGEWYLARVQPYRTLDNVIDGVVLTFTDITEHIKAIEAREAQHLAEGIINTVREPLVVLDGAFRVISASQSFYREFRVQPQDTVGNLIYDLGSRQWDIPALRQLLESVRQHNQTFEDYPVEQDFPTIGRRKMLLNARRIVSKTGESNLILLAVAAVT
ncbi:SAM-dependent methyltransferase [Glaciimonas immobilis]|nr:SAM-dependent methyltransferase [Glaciimonas immobilis]